MSEPGGGDRYGRQEGQAEGQGQAEAEAEDLYRDRACTEAAEEVGNGAGPPRQRERWRKVRRAAGYKVSSLARVRSVDRTLADGRAAGGVLLVPFLAGGYLHVTINGEQVPVHHLVLEAFRGPRPYGTEGCHGPNGALDNRASELRWDTHRANIRDKRMFGQALTGRSGPAGMNGKEEETEGRSGTGVSHQNWLVSPVAGDVPR